MSKSLIRINYATSDEIATIHGVGKVLANRIVEFRKTNGYFRNTDDLAKVDGISDNFAVMLSSQIDWQAPNIGEIKKESSWGGALYFAIELIIFLWLFFNQLLPSLYDVIKYYQLGHSNLWVWIWINGSLSLAFISLIIMTILNILKELVTKVSLGEKLRRVQLFLGGIAITFLVSSGLGHATYYQLYAPTGWKTLLNNPGYMAGLAGGFIFVLIFVPQLLVYKYAKLATNSILAILFDIGMVISAPSIALYLWVSQDELPVWFMLLWIIPGIGYLLAGWSSLRYGKSFFYTVATRWLPIEKFADDTGTWIRWLNLRLPDPEQQKALKEALEEMYPPSKARTIFGFIVFGAGGWILSTLLSSLIDWLFQNWLDKLLK